MMRLMWLAAGRVTLMLHFAPYAHRHVGCRHAYGHLLMLPFFARFPSRLLTPIAAARSQPTPLSHTSHDVAMSSD